LKSLRKINIFQAGKFRCRR